MTKTAKTPTLKTDFQAPFGGEIRTFKLHDDDLRTVERETQTGLMALMQRFVSGGWKVDDVRTVLAYGLIGNERKVRATDHKAASVETLMRREIRDTLKAAGGENDHHWAMVDQEVRAGKLEVCAQIATMVLGAALYGIRGDGTLKIESEAA
jgi:hypothetical protein